MSREQPSYPRSRRLAALCGIPLFGISCGVFVWLAMKWSAQLAIDSQNSVYTDGLSLSVSLARIAAVLLFIGFVLSILELWVGPRVMAVRPAT
jgi:hypothetical protein